MDLQKINREIIEKELLLFLDMLALAAACIKRKDAIIADFQKRAEKDETAPLGDIMESAIKAAIEKLSGMAFENLEKKGA
jgi:hypothetical protein